MATSNSTCPYAECDRTDLVARKYCKKHYQLGIAQGWITPRKRLDPEQRFERDTQAMPNGCLIWVGSLNGDGYGLTRVDKKSVRAHRWAWEKANGPIPEGMLVDHICHNRACVALAHLRLATREQNNQYRKGANFNNEHCKVRGVSWDSRRSCWVANVHKDGKTHYCGSFSDLEEAGRAAAAGRARLFQWPDFDPSEFSLDRPDAA